MEDDSAWRIRPGHESKLGMGCSSQRVCVCCVCCVWVRVGLGDGEEERIGGEEEGRGVLYLSGYE